MKRLMVMLAVIGMLVSSAAAYAGPNDDWLLYIRASSPDDSKALNNCIFGTKSGYGDSPAGAEDKSQIVNTVAPAIGCFDLGNGANGTGYYQDLRSPVLGTGSAKAWTIKLWALGSYGYSDIVLSAWNPSGSHDINGALPIRLKVLHDPSGTYSDGQMLISSWDANRNGSQSLPAYSWTFRGAGSVRSLSSPIVLELSASCDALPAVPEPGSVVALLSGLMGLVGIRIRRRG